MGKLPNRRDLEKRIIIGVDECNNGHSLPPEVPFIVVAYTHLPWRYLEDKMIKKGRGFSPKTHNTENFLESANEFLRDHLDFSYAVIQKSRDSVWFSGVRALATARLIHEAYKKCELAIDKDDPIVIIDGRPFDNSAEKKIKKVLDAYGDKIKLNFINNADAHHLPVMAADRIAYCLGSLWYRGNQRKWPYRHQRLNFIADELEHKEGPEFSLRHAWKNHR